MSEQNCPQMDEIEEPPAKISRKNLRPRTVQRKQQPRKCKKVVKNTPLNICDLPSEILEKIIGNINICHHNPIRRTCRRMKDVSDLFVMHEFKKALMKHTRGDPNSEASAALMVIKQATEVYTRSGFESTFCGYIVPILLSLDTDSFGMMVNGVKEFLLHFYQRVTGLIGEESSQRWRLLYTITLMRLIKSFDKSIISSTTMPLRWRIVVELKKLWLGKLWTLKGQPLNQSRHRYNLLINLSKMLIYNIAERGFNNSHHLTVFTFTINGSIKIWKLFRSCLEDGSEEFQWPSEWPDDQFTVNLDIFCKEVIKWGCSQSHHIIIGPFSSTDECEHVLRKYNI